MYYKSKIVNSFKDIFNYISYMISKISYIIKYFTFENIKLLLIK